MTAFGASCPHCETLFKVYPDQLRLHNGFANCGSCGRTFDVQAVLIFLPAHETSFLERNTPMVDGLPVLNAVARVTRNNQPSTESQATPVTNPITDKNALNKACRHQRKHQLLTTSHLLSLMIRIQMQVNHLSTTRPLSIQQVLKR